MERGTQLCVNPTVQKEHRGVPGTICSVYSDTQNENVPVYTSSGFGVV